MRIDSFFSGTSTAYRETDTEQCICYIKSPMADETLYLPVCLRNNVVEKKTFSSLIYNLRYSRDFTYKVKLGKNDCLYISSSFALREEDNKLHLLYFIRYKYVPNRPTPKFYVFVSPEFVCDTKSIWCNGLKNNFLVVGIHNKGSKTKYINYGTFLGYILDNIEKEEIIFNNEIEKNKSITINDEPKLEKENKKEKIKKIELVHEGINEEENKKEKYQNNKDNHSNNKVSLKNINSKYIIKMVLSYLCQKNQIKIFKYNKMVQNIMDLNLNKCKFFSGRYIEYETNIKGKEYNGYNDILIYEGGYLNGKRNGKCKEYDNYGQLIFEGEYLNGKRNGKGKEYYDNGKLLFEGNFLNGNRFTGKVYDIKGNMSYDLENMNGLIKKYYRDGKIEFEGEYLNGKKNGKGKEYNDDGNLIFEGEYLNDERNGKGKEYGDLIYKGEFLNGKKHGKGKEYFFDMVVFEGEYLNGNRWNGKGYRKNNIITYTLKNGNGHVEEYHRYNTLTFEGEYLNGNRNGKGKE